MPQRDSMMPLGKRQELQSGAEYTAEEEEFILAVAAWQRKYKCRYPSSSDILRVAKSLGYRRVEPIKDNTECL